MSKKISGLQQASKQKKLEAWLKTQQAIAKLTDRQQKITVRSVAREAGVSVSYIYKYPELAYSIQKLREQQKYSTVKSDRPTSNTKKQLELLQQEKSELVKELAELKASIELADTGKKTAKCLQAENIKLVLENQQLKQELEYTRKNLQEAHEFILSQGYSDIDELRDEARTNIIREISQE